MRLRRINGQPNYSLHPPSKMYAVRRRFTVMVGENLTKSTATLFLKSPMPPEVCVMIPILKERAYWWSILVEKVVCTVGRFFNTYILQISTSTSWARLFFNKNILNFSLFYWLKQICFIDWDGLLFVIRTSSSILEITDILFPCFLGSFNIFIFLFFVDGKNV